MRKFSSASSFLASAYINNDEKIISEMENNHKKSFTHTHQPNDRMTAGR